MRHVALLRGINLGSARRVSMPELRELLTDAGFGDVRTLLQSGNVVLTSRLSAQRLERDLHERIAAGLGVDTAVVVRSRDQLAAVVAQNPMADVADDPKRLQVSFLSAALPADAAERLEAADIAPDRVAVRGREIYSWHPDGLQNSRLARLVVDQKLGVTATARNWNTVTKLLALAEG